MYIINYNLNVNLYTITYNTNVYLHIIKHYTSIYIYTINDKQKTKNCIVLLNTIQNTLHIYVYNRTNKLIPNTTKIKLHTKNIKNQDPLHQHLKYIYLTQKLISTTTNKQHIIKHKTTHTLKHIIKTKHNPKTSPKTLPKIQRPRPTGLTTQITHTTS